MEVPTKEHIEVHTLSGGVTWLGEDGILYSIVEANKTSLDTTKENFEYIKKLVNGRRVCSIVESSKLQPLDSETLEYYKGELSKVYKAMAVVTNNAWGRMIANLLLGLTNQAYPTKIFGTVEEAQNWIAQYND